MRSIKGLTKNTIGIEEHALIINTWRMRTRVSFALMAENLWHDLSALADMKILIPYSYMAALGGGYLGNAMLITSR